MLWTLLLTALAEEVDQEETVIQEISVFHYGMDPILSAKVAVNYVQAVSEHSSGKLNPVMMDDVFPLEKSTVLQGATIERCEGYPVSPIRFTKTIQELDYALSYFELDKAKELAISAETSLTCLSEPPKAETAADLFFFTAITLFYGNDLEGAKTHFSRAIAYKPNLDWNEMFGPEAKVLFEEARKEYSELEQISFTVFPESAKSMLWVNGIPVLRDAPLTLTEGENHIQILGSSIENVVITVDGSAELVELVVPSAINDVGLTWLDRPSRRAEVGEVLRVLYPENPSYFVSSNEQVWMYDPQKTEWSELVVPVSAKVFSLDTRRTIGKAMYWSGLSFTAISGGLAAQDYAQLSSLAGSSATTWKQFNADYETFQNAEVTYRRNATMTAVSLGVTGVGWLMSR